MNYKPKGPRLNSNISANRVKLIDDEGRDHGIMLIQEALKLAASRKLDLMEVGSKADIPVCKMIDYGKHKYQLSKKDSENKKKQKVVLIKEIKLRPNIGEGDYKVKLNKIIELLNDSCKVKVTMKFRGREAAFQDVGKKIMNRILEELEGVGKIEKDISNLGSQLIMVLVKG